MKIKPFYLLPLYFLLVLGCKKTPNSTSQGNTNTPPQTGQTYLSDTTINFPTGLVPSTLDELLSIPVLDTSVLPVLERRADLDLHYDLSISKPGMPTPQLQTWGNCSAWAVGYGMMSYLYAVKGGYSDYNLTDKTFSPAFIYNQNNHLVNNGISLTTALKFIRDKGCCKWMYMPEFITYFTTQPSPDALLNATNFKITNCYRVSKVDINFMKILIDVWNYPLVFSCKIDSGFEFAGTQSWELRQGNRYVWKGLITKIIGGHSMLIVGYDDAINAFKVLNSWGKQWGALKFNDPNNNGYCWIDYNVFKNVVIKNQDGVGIDVPEIFIGTLERPKLSTNNPVSITETTAISGGNITNNENNSIISRGICWSKVENPTIADNKIVDGAIGIGSFTCNISGLSTGTTYYVRAYAVTGIGTTYGNDVSFTTSGSGSSDNTVTDIDGNVYHTVKIGTQTWMVENLKTTHYRNGDPIEAITNVLTFLFSDSGAYDVYINSNTGLLYNWYATIDYRNICPVGWHIPSDAEWTTLTNFLGGESVAGDKMKATTSWNSPATTATDESGFTALPAGYLDANNLGQLTGYGLNCYWWSSTIGYALGTPWVRGLGNNNSGISRVEADKNNGFSIRCIKD